MDRLRGRRHSFTLAAAAAVWLLGASHAQAARLTSLQIESEAGDYVGEGESAFFTPDAGTFQIFSNNLNSVSIYFQAPSFGPYWSLQFAAPGSATLTPGLYEGATEYIQIPSAGPGMRVSGNSHGCSSGLSGWFEVLE